MSEFNGYDERDDVDQDDEADDVDQDDEEWKEGECDNCYGETVEGPLGPVYCACSIGLGADPEDCRCGPPQEETD